LLLSANSITNLCFLENTLFLHEPNKQESKQVDPNRS
jgi:hypothetical protein